MYCVHVHVSSVHCYRERALDEEKRRPMFRPQREGGERNVSYPNVYDSMATIKLTPAFLAGKPVGPFSSPPPPPSLSPLILYCVFLFLLLSLSLHQVGLPTAAEKKDHEYFEEVIVPHSAVPPPFITPNILISELDDTAKVTLKLNNLMAINYVPILLSLSLPLASIQGH